MINANVKISKRLALTNSTASMVVMVLNASVSIWLQQYLLRRVSPDEYSLISVLSSLMMFLPLLTEFLTSGIGRYVVEAYAKGDERRVTQIASTMFPILFASSIVILIFGYFAVINVDSILNIASGQISEAKIMLSMMFFSFIIRLLLAPFSIGLYVKQKFVIENSINFGAELFRIGLLFILLFSISTSVIWVIVASTSANLIGLLVIVVISRRLVPSLRFYIKEFRLQLARTLMSFGGWSAVGSLGGTIRSAADPLILNRFATPVDVTIFYLGSLADREIRRLLSVVTGPIQPQLIAMHADGRSDRLASAFLRLGRFSMWSLLFMIGPLLIFRHELFQLYLREEYLTYNSATVVMFLLLCYLPISYSLYGLDKIVMATAKIRAYMIITSISQVLNLAFTFFFVAFLHWGGVGSALATLIVGTTVTLFGYFPLSLRLTGITIKDYLIETIIPGLIPGLFGVISWIILRIIVNPSSWMELGLCVFFGMVIYLFVLYKWCLKPMDRSDLKVILTAINLKFQKKNIKSSK